MSHKIEMKELLARADDQSMHGVFGVVPRKDGIRDMKAAFGMHHISA